MKKDTQASEGLTYETWVSFPTFPFWAPASMFFRVTGKKMENLCFSLDLLIALPCDWER